MTITRREALQRTAWLIGGALSSSAIAGVLAGCSADPSADWTSKVFNDHDMAIVSAMADHLLPKTSTPGAKEVFADRFVDAMLLDYFTKPAQDTFVAGLAAFDADCQKTHGKPFVGLATAQKDEMFKKYEQNSPGLQPTVWGSQISEVVPAPTFYRLFKQLTLVGYFTSEEVGKKILDYDPVPGRFDPCVPLGNTRASIL